MMLALSARYRGSRLGSLEEPTRYAAANRRSAAWAAHRTPRQNDKLPTPLSRTDRHVGAPAAGAIGQSPAIKTQA